MFPAHIQVKLPYGHWLCWLLRDMLLSASPWAALSLVLPMLEPEWHSHGSWLWHVPHHPSLDGQGMSGVYH